MLTYSDIGSRLALTILSALNSHKKLLGVIGLASVLVSSYAPPVLGQGQFFHSLLESVAAVGTMRRSNASSFPRAKSVKAETRLKTSTLARASTDRATYKW